MGMEVVTSGTQDVIGSRSFWSATPVMMTQGPSWESFDAFKTRGRSELSQIPPGTVATLRTKNGIYRILRDADFLSLLGKASEVNRLRQGFMHIRHAIELWATHPDQQHMQLVIEGTSFIAGTPSLPEQVGHRPFDLPSHEVSTEETDDFDVLKDEIPTPEL